MAFDEEKISEDLGPANAREPGSGYMPLYFFLSAADNAQLEAISQKRDEAIAVLVRKILEHKLLNDLSPPIDSHRRRVRVSVSEQMRELIDQVLAGKQMKRSEFIALQVGDYLQERNDGNDAGQDNDSCSDRPEARL